VRARKQHAWSQEEVAEKIGTTQANLSRWERGITTPIPEHLRLLCTLYQKEPEELFPEVIEAPAASPEAASGTAFWYNMMLPNPAEFYGRERELQRLFNRVRKAESSSIVGPRRIGKTWLLRYLQLVAPQQLGPQFVIGYLDATAPACATLVGLTTEMLAVLDIPLSPEVDTETNMRALQTGVKELRANGRLPILCIDEFEGVCKTPDFRLEFLEYLRAIAQDGLGLVVASKRPLIDIAQEMMGHDGQTSPFFNIFMQIALKPFSLQEAERFVQGKAKEAMFNETECEYLLRYSEYEGQKLWYPLRLQLVGTLLQEDKLLAAQGAPELYRPEDP
jgi:transcriptional regulator with XRE-family HTH domain